MSPPRAPDAMRETWDILARLRARDLVDVAERHARSHDCTVEELLGRSRQRGPCWARQAMWAELMARGHWSHNRIGELFDRDHSTIIYGVREHLRRTQETA